LQVTDQDFIEEKKTSLDEVDELIEEITKEKLPIKKTKMQK